jgi:hypothetical protein
MVIVTNEQDALHGCARSLSPISFLGAICQDCAGNILLRAYMSRRMNEGMMQLLATK